MVRAVSLLPPDPRRLRAILAHLDERLAQNETVAVYLRLQREAVLAALARAEGDRRGGRAPQRRTARPGRAGAPPTPPSPPSPPSPPRSGYVVEQKRTPHGREPAVVHRALCTMVDGTARHVRADEARAALTDPHSEPCPFCRPDTELGTDLA